MAQPFLDNLKILVGRHLPLKRHLVCKHFFSGAALYADGVICASLTPVGLAFKLPAKLCSELIDCGAASELKYFAKSPVKKGYVLFSNFGTLSDADMAMYFRMAVEHVRPMTT